MIAEQVFQTNHDVLQEGGQLFNNFFIVFFALQCFLYIQVVMGYMDLIYVFNKTKLCQNILNNGNLYFKPRKFGNYNFPCNVPRL